MTEEYGHIPDGFHLSDKEVEDLRKSKKELTEYGKQKLRELMDKDLIIRDNGKETFRLSSGFALGKKVPETKLEIKMTEPIQAKVSDEDFQKIVEAFNNPQPYPDEMLEEVEIAAKEQSITKNERIDLAIKELGYMIMGGQDMREYAGSVAYIMDVLESLRDKEDTEWKDSADGVA